jgi:NAD-dependent histone deacetylase SIR2
MHTVAASDSDQLRALASQLVKSKRVAFVVGAGISTASGIPDFRSAATGLFVTLKERNPDVKLATGKDLFHSNLFQVGLYSSHHTS